MQIEQHRLNVNQVADDAADTSNIHSNELTSIGSANIKVNPCACQKLPASTQTTENKSLRRKLPNIYGNSGWGGREGVASTQHDTNDNHKNNQLHNGNYGFSARPLAAISCHNMRCHCRLHLQDFRISMLPKILSYRNFNERKT